MKPFILTNFKHYPSAILENAEKLTRIHIEAKEKTNGNIAIAVNHLDIQNISIESIVFNQFYIITRDNLKSQVRIGDVMKVRR